MTNEVVVLFKGRENVGPAQRSYVVQAFNLKMFLFGSLPMSDQYSHVILPESNRKYLIFWCFQGL